MLKFGFTTTSNSHAIQIMEKLAQRPCAKPFLLPVDPSRDGVPNYYQVITEPVDISLVTEKLLLHKYACVDEWVRDVHRIRDNAKIFNGTNSYIYQMAVCLVGLFERKVKSFYRHDSQLWTQRYQQISSKLTDQMKLLPSSIPVVTPSQQITRSYRQMHSNITEVQQQQINKPLSFNKTDDFSSIMIAEPLERISQMSSSSANRKKEKEKTNNGRDINKSISSTSTKPTSASTTMNSSSSSLSSSSTHPFNENPNGQRKKQLKPLSPHNQSEGQKAPINLFGDINLPFPLPPTLPPVLSTPHSGSQGTLQPTIVVHNLSSNDTQPKKGSSAHQSTHQSTAQSPLQGLAQPPAKIQLSLSQKKGQSQKPTSTNSQNNQTIQSVTKPPSINGQQQQNTPKQLNNPPPQQQKSQKPPQPSQQPPQKQQQQPPPKQQQSSQKPPHQTPQLPHQAQIVVDSQQQQQQLQMQLQLQQMQQLQLQQQQDARLRVNIFGATYPIGIPGASTISPPEIGPIGAKQVGEAYFDLYVSDAKDYPPFRFYNRNTANKPDPQSEQKRAYLMRCIPSFNTISDLDTIVTIIKMIEQTQNITNEVNLASLKPQTIDELCSFVMNRIQSVGQIQSNVYY